MQHSDRVQMQEQSQQLMNGPLKHIRAAALAAALVPLASVFAAPASAADEPQRIGRDRVRLSVFTVPRQYDFNGLQDARRDTGIGRDANFVVSIRVGTDTLTTDTGPDGVYYVFVPEGTCTIGVVVPQGMATAPSNVAWMTPSTATVSRTGSGQVSRPQPSLVTTTTTPTSGS